VTDAEPAVVSLVWRRAQLRPQVEEFIKTARSSAARARP
jgi:hypothetical protein